MNSRKSVWWIAVMVVLSMLGMAEKPPAGVPVKPKPQERQEKPVADGRKAPKFSLSSTAGDKHSLEDYAEKTLVLVWINPHCPATQRLFRDGQMKDMLQQLEEMRKNNDIAWLGICSNSDSTAQQCDAIAREHKIELTVLMDTEGDVGKRYDARKTPQVFVIDGDGVIRYEGAFDDDPTGSRKQSGLDVMNYALQAVRAIRELREVKPKLVEPYGLPIRYPVLVR